MEESLCRQSRLQKRFVSEIMVLFYENSALNTIWYKKVRFQNFYFGLSIINNVLLYEYIYIYWKPS